MHHATPCQPGAVIRREVIIRSETADLSFPKTLRVIPSRDYGPGPTFRDARVIRSEAFLAFLDSNRHLMMYIVRTATVHSRCR
jgi:hypothetical protein